VPFTLIYTGKYRTEDKSKIDTLQKLNTTQKKQTHKPQNYPGSAAFYDTRPGNEVGIFYNAPESTRGTFKNEPQTNVHHNDKTIIPIQNYSCQQ